MLRLGSRRAFAPSSDAMKLEVPSSPLDSSCSPSQTIDSFKQMESPKTDCSKQMEVDSAYPSILRYCTVHADNARSSPISE
ncbi:hypothetical protein QJS10_CPA16g00261 [Acorus calamus]|uniref:Uncharacterized protein n=1 Tax=Acorus calamus TaxID=4465 RepID=A0AAV9D3B3_ACOCL|nr:hypothetical protein QJS10_CPA16g00261 [Acorus calamus]